MEKTAKRHGYTQTIKAVRTGWPGVWDAFIAAIMRRPRLEVLRDVTISLYAIGDVEIGIAQAEVEAKAVE